MVCHGLLCHDSGMNPLQFIQIYRFLFCCEDGFHSGSSSFDFLFDKRFFGGGHFLLVAVRGGGLEEKGVEEEDTDVGGIDSFAFVLVVDGGGERDATINHHI